MSAGRGALIPSTATATSSRFARRRPVIARRAPSRPSSSAIARPMPELAPVTSAVRPLRPRSMRLLSGMAAPAILLAAMLFAAAPAHAILTRPDRDDAEYLELATRYPSAVTLGPGIEGVLIAPRWVLTTAGAAALLQGAKRRPPLVLGGKPNAIQQTFVHPRWNQGSEADIALVLLKDAVAAVDATPVRPDADEIDEVVFILG